MKYAKDLGLTTYNSIIQDIYDANPAVQMANGNEKEEEKYKQTKKNPTSRVLLKETLRLRNTSVLLLKQKEMIFRYEKERLSQLKVSLPPFDDDIDPNIICECPEEEELDTSFNFPRFRFNIRNWFATVPVPFTVPAPVTVPNPYTAPETQPGGETQPGEERQPQGEGQRQPDSPRVPDIYPPRRPEPRARPGFPRFPRIPFPRIPPLPPLLPPRIPGLASARQYVSSFDAQKVFSGGSRFRAALGNFLLGSDPLTGQKSFTPRLQPAMATATAGSGTGTTSPQTPKVPSVFRVNINGVEVGSYTKGAKIPLSVAEEFAKITDTSIDEFARKVKSATKGNISVDVPKPVTSPPVTTAPRPTTSLLSSIKNFKFKNALTGLGTSTSGGPKGFILNFIGQQIIGMSLDALGQKYIVDPLAGPDGVLSRSLMRSRYYNKIDEQLNSGMTPEEILARMEALRDERIATLKKQGDAGNRTIPYVEADFRRARNYLMSHKAQKAGDVLDTGLITGPEANIGMIPTADGRNSYHIDTKFSKDLSMERIVGMMDDLARGYQARGRDIEFSNTAVAGIIYDPNASDEEKIDLLTRAFSAHSHSKHGDFHSIDYYIPNTGTGRGDESAEGANILTPTVQGGQVNFGQSADYGAFVTVTDSQGKVLTKTGHGDDRAPRSGSISVPIKPVEKSDADPEPDLMSLFSPINKDTEIGVDPLMDFEQDLPFLIAPQIKTGSIQYVPIPMDLGSKVEYVVKDLHTPAWGNMSVIGG